MSEQSTEYIVPTTESAEVARLRERADRASAEAKRLREIARKKQGPFWQVDKKWTTKYGCTTAVMLAVIRDYIRLEHGVCFAEQPTLLDKAGFGPRSRPGIRAFDAALETGEFFWVRRPGKTYVLAASQEALEAFLKGEGSHTGARGVHTLPREVVNTLPREVPHTLVRDDREPLNDNKAERTINDNVVVSHSFDLSKKSILKLQALQSADWLEKWIPIAEKGFSLGKVRKPEAWLVSYAGNSWCDDVPDWAADVSMERDYRPGEFADFYAPLSEGAAEQ